MTQANLSDPVVPEVADEFDELFDRFLERSEAARQLGIGRRTLYTKMEKLGIEPSFSLRLDRAS